MSFSVDGVGVITSVLPRSLPVTLLFVTLITRGLPCCSSSSSANTVICVQPACQFTDYFSDWFVDPMLCLEA